MPDADVFCKAAGGNIGANGAASNNHSNRTAVQHNQATANNNTQPENRLRVLSTGFKVVETFII